MAIIARNTPKDEECDTNLINFKEREQLYGHFRSLCFLPLEYIKDTFEMMSSLLLAKDNSLRPIVKAFEMDFMTAPEMWNYNSDPYVPYSHSS